MSDQFSIKARRALIRKEAISSLDLNVISGLRLIDAVTFDKSPIDFGVVVAGRLAMRQFALKVHFATYVKLKIKGDMHFKAELVKLPSWRN